MTPILDEGPLERTFHYESKHDYDPDTDDRFPHSYPGASKIVITFDPQTSTERNCDWVKISYKDKEDTSEITYTGRNYETDTNWPVSLQEKER